ncbi:DUF6171 family protein [Paenibacillus kobensis]|uniref:DUF6171 family protein n=1 Tax=Paenibacillus kobensis TaxID=59841 RepID=UPI000FD8D7D9|nr:DUF6171 family protein [Paenibacillus kobensis]
MKTTSSLCKGCSPDFQVSQEQINIMVDKLSRFPDDCVPDAAYERRLAACAACSSLQNGTTCAHCGCYIQVRAKLTRNNCPAPGGSRWSQDS